MRPPARSLPLLSFRFIAAMKNAFIMKRAAPIVVTSRTTTPRRHRMYKCKLYKNGRNSLAPAYKSRIAARDIF